MMRANSPHPWVSGWRVSQGYPFRETSTQWNRAITGRREERQGRLRTCAISAASRGIARRCGDRVAVATVETAAPGAPLDGTRKQDAESEPAHQSAQVSRGTSKAAKIIKTLGAFASLRAVSPGHCGKTRGYESGAQPLVQLLLAIRIAAGITAQQESTPGQRLRRLPAASQGSPPSSAGAPVSNTEGQSLAADFTRRLCQR